MNLRANSSLFFCLPSNRKKNIAHNEEETLTKTKGEIDMKEQLTKTVVMAVAGGALAGISFLAGRKEGIQIARELNSKSESVGYMRALSDIAKNSITSK